MVVRHAGSFWVPCSSVLGVETGSLVQPPSHWSVAPRDLSKHYRWLWASAHDQSNASGFATLGGECLRVLTCNHSNQCSHPHFPTWCLPLGPQWPRKNHKTTHCTSKPWAWPSVLALATNPLGWILLVLPLPFMGNEVDPCPGRKKTRSLNNAHCVWRPFPRWILWLPRNMVPARLWKVMLTVIKGVYHERFAVTHCTNFDYSK